MLFVELLHHPNLLQHLLIKFYGHTALLVVVAGSECLPVRAENNAMPFVCAILIGTHAVACRNVAYILNGTCTHKGIPRKQSAVGEVGRD